MYLSIYLSTYLPIYLSIYPSIYLSIYVSICLSISLSLSLYLSISLSLCLTVCLSIFLPVYLQAWKPSYSARLLHFSKLTTSKTNKHEAILRDFLNGWTWQRQKRSNSARLLHFQSWQHRKRSNSARLPQFLNLTTSKTKQFCKTSSIYELDNIKNKAILRDFLQADGLVPMRFPIFPLHLSKVLCRPRKIDARSYEVLHLSRKIISANLQIWYSKMQPFSGNQRPDLLTSLMNMSLYCACHAKCIFADPLQMPHACHGFWKCYKTLTFYSLLTAQSLAPATRNDIWISKSGAIMWCFVHFDFEMCFAPQRRALFRRLNFQKWSEHGVFCTFWLRNVLRATTAWTFSTSQLLKVVQSWAVLCILTSKCASRHDGVDFFDIAASKSGPKLRCIVHFDLDMCFAPQRRALFHLSSGQMAPHPPLLASLPFDPPELQIIGKTQCFATFLPFRASPSSFFWLFLFSHLLSSNLLFSLTLPISAFHLSILSEVWLLNFLRT